MEEERDGGRDSEKGSEGGREGGSRKGGGREGGRKGRRDLSKKEKAAVGVNYMRCIISKCIRNEFSSLGKRMGAIIGDASSSTIISVYFHELGSLCQKNLFLWVPCLVDDDKIRGLRSEGRQTQVVNIPSPSQLDGQSSSFNLNQLEIDRLRPSSSGWCAVLFLCLSLEAS